MDPVTILKFGSLILGSFLGILSAVTKTEEDIPSPEPGKPDRTVKRLTRWGKLSLAGLVLSFIAAFVLQIVDERDATDKERKRADDARTQLQRSEATLNGVQRLLVGIRGEQTRFKSIEGTMAFELPAAEPRVKNLMVDLDRLAAQITGADGNVNSVGGLANAGHGWLHLTRGRPYTDARVTALLAAHRALFASLDLWKPLCMVSITKAPSTGERATQRRGLMDGDLVTQLLNTNNNFSRDAYYSPQSHRLIMMLGGLVADGGEWISKGRVNGISDFSKATIVLSFGADGRGGNKGALLSDSRLLSCDMTFGAFRCGLTNFATIADEDGFVRFFNTMPEAEAILEGTTPFGFGFLQH